MTPEQEKYHQKRGKEDSNVLLALVLGFLGIKTEEPNPEEPSHEETKPVERSKKPPGLLLGEELTEEEKERLLPEDAKELIRDLGGARCFRVLVKREE